MTWVNPPIVATGDFITAGLWNTYIRANGLHLRGLLPDATTSNQALISTAGTSAGFGSVTNAVMAATERTTVSMFMHWNSTSGTIPTGWSQLSGANGRNVKGVDGTNYTASGQIGGGDSQNNQHNHDASHSHTTTSVSVSGSASISSLSGSSGTVSVSGGITGNSGSPSAVANNIRTVTPEETNAAGAGHSHPVGSYAFSGSGSGAISGTGSGTISGTAAGGTATTTTFNTGNGLSTMDNRSAWYSAYHILKTSTT